jgi:NAD-dependent deacetylase
MVRGRARIGRSGRRFLAVLDDATLQQIARTRGWLDDAEHVVVLTGAGISTDSGIPDFRGPNGVWTKDPKAEKMATLQHYLADPAVRRAAWRNRLASPAFQAEPNAGHVALVELVRRGTLDALVTQNVDGLHQKAGTPPELVVEVHGTLHWVICWDCGERAPMARALARVSAGEDDPACRSCGGILKSDTISFGQALVPGVIDRALAAAEACDLLLAVGSSLQVYPIAHAVPLAAAAGARVVIVNGEPTQFDALADAVLRGPIGEILPRLLPSLG